MTRYAETTTVPIARSRAAIDALLRKWGADGIRWTDHFSAGCVQLEFLWTHDSTQYLARLSIQLPDDDALRLDARDVRSGRFLEARYRKLQEARGKTEHRILLLWLTAAFNAVNAGLVDAETLFLPFLVGRDGQTVAEAALPRLPDLLRGAAAGLLSLPARTSGRGPQ